MVASCQGGAVTIQGWQLIRYDFIRWQVQKPERRRLIGKVSSFVGLCSSKPRGRVG